MSRKVYRGAGHTLTTSQGQTQLNSHSQPKRLNYEVKKDFPMFTLTFLFIITQKGKQN